MLSSFKLFWVSDAELNGVTGSRLLLSLVYFLLQNFRFRSALELVDFLLRQSDIRKAVTMSQQDDATRTSLLSLMQQVRARKAAIIC